MPYVIDFETKPIKTGSGHFPKPVGVAIQQLGGIPEYYSFGHPGENSCFEDFAKTALDRIWRSGDKLIFHNAKFDVGVAVEHWGFEYPQGRIEDTQILLYLNEPLSANLALKPSAERLLGMAPEEQDLLTQWILCNQAQILRIPEARYYLDHYTDKKTITESIAGAFIGFAPAVIVAPYAKGDVVRTGKLWEYLYDRNIQMQMDGAYARELKIIRIGTELEQCGVRVDRERLLKDEVKFRTLMEQAATEVRRFVGDVDLNKKTELAAALERSPYCKPLKRTPTGKLSTAKDALVDAIIEPALLKAMRYWSTLHTLTNTFYRGWIRLSAGDGYLHPVWHQTRNAEGYGTRTGRFSCSDPNLTNVPTEFDDPVFEGLELPYMRQYLLPDEGKVIVPADFNGQEMRILAHYAEGRAMEIYQNDPKADFHVVASDLVEQTSGIVLKRKRAKITGFSLIYGSGVPALAAQLGVDRQEGYAIKEAYLDAIPGLRQFQESFDYRNQVRTWGGRILPVEPPRMYNGSLWTFNYKLCNYLIQGSAADQTKESAIRYDENRDNGDLLFTVHDEVVIQVEEEFMKKEVEVLKWAMEKQPGWDVPFIAEVEWGHNYHDLREYVA